MRKPIILVIVLLCLVVLVSGCISDNKSAEPETYKENNITFSYPGTWQIANATSPNAIVAIADPNTIQNGNPTTLVVVQKPDVPKGNRIDEVYATNYKSFFNNTGYTEISEGNITIDDNIILENIYKSDTDQKEYRALWYAKNDNIYVILCTAKITDFKDQTTNFDFIINSFKLV
ncbi:MAG: PsbP-related protein [Methanobacterium sp.]|nr:PsbP-related protein [Methanobacterium sp.]